MVEHCLDNDDTWRLLEAVKSLKPKHQTLNPLLTALRSELKRIYHLALQHFPRMRNLLREGSYHMKCLTTILPITTLSKILMSIRVPSFEWMNWACCEPFSLLVNISLCL